MDTFNDISVTSLRVHHVLWKHFSSSVRSLHSVIFYLFHLFRNIGRVLEHDTE